MSSDVTQLRGVQGLVTFESSDLGAALSAAESAARELVAEEHWGPDIFVAAPEGAKWTADELNEQLIYQQSYHPQGDVRAIVIAYAHLMDARLHDHLLKMVEEPPAPVLFMFVVNDGDKLPVTVQSRIFRRVKVKPRGVEELTSLIQEASGTAPSSGVGALCQLSPLIASHLTGDDAGDAVALAEKYVASLKGVGFTSGFRSAKSLKMLAKAVSGGAAESPKTKAAQREGLRAGLQMLQSTHMHTLAHGTDIQAVDADVAWRRVEQAVELAEMHLPADQVLTFAMTRGA